MTSKISDLNASQLARHAFNTFLFSGGPHVTGAKLIYRALQLDPKNPEAIRCLSDLLAIEGTEIFSAIALEYALSENVKLTNKERNEFDDLLFLSKWTWKFSRHKSGKPLLSKEDFSNRTEFEVDETKYRQFLEQIIWPPVSLVTAFQAAHTLSGALAGFLVHMDPQRKIGVEESLFPERFQISPTYQEWLESDTVELDSLEEARQKKSGRH